MAHAVRRILLESNLVTDDQMRRIEGWYDLLDRSLVEKCYRSSLISDEDLLRILVDQGAVDASQTLSDSPPVDAALGALSRELAERHRAIPLSVSPNEVVIGMLDPFDNIALKQIRAFAFLPVKAVAVQASLLFPALTKAYGVEVIVPVENPAQFLSDAPVDEEKPKLERFAPAAEKEPIAAPPSSAPADTTPATGTDMGADALANAAFPSDEDAPLPDPGAPVPTPVDSLPPPTAATPAPLDAFEATFGVPDAPASSPTPIDVAPPSSTNMGTPQKPVEDVPNLGETEPSDTPGTNSDAAAAPATKEEPLAAADNAPLAPPASSEHTDEPKTPAWNAGTSTTPFTAPKTNPPEAPTYASFDELRAAAFADLVPPFRTALLLGVQDSEAKGWAARGTSLDDAAAKGITIELSLPSAFRRAWEWGMVAAGSKLEPSRAERALFNALTDTAPSTFAVFPLKTDPAAEHPRALLYVDVADGLLDEDTISIARRLAESMAQSLAALDAEDKLPK